MSGSGHFFFLDTRMCAQALSTKTVHSVIDAQTKDSYATFTDVENT